MFFRRTFSLLFSIVLFNLQAISSFDLVCDYEESSWLAVGMIKNCYAKKLNILSPETITSVDGEVTKHNDIPGFWVDNEICHYVPKEIAQFFPELRAFGIARSGLQIITSADLEPFPELVRLALFGNKLAYIEHDLFKHNTKLQSVGLKDNNVVLIEAEFLNPLNQLYYAEIEFQCLKQTCEFSSCIGYIKEQLKSNCPSESVFGSISYVKNLEKSLIESKIQKKKFCEDL